MRLLLLICCLTACHASRETPAPAPSPSPTGGRILDGKSAPDSHIIDPVIKQHAHELKFCSSAGGRDPRYVAIAWLVGENGSVTQTKIVSLGRQSDVTVAQCVITRLKAWKFPAVPGGVLLGKLPVYFYGLMACGGHRRAKFRTSQAPVLKKAASVASSSLQAMVSTLLAIGRDHRS